MIKILICFFPLLTFSQPLKIKLDIMSFNLMCDWCTKPKEKFLNFEERFTHIKNFLQQKKMDFYSLQEIRTSSQVEEILSVLGEDYNALYFSWGPFNYPDATLIYNQTKFELIDVNYYWLGPRQGSFSFGWEWALPRMLIIGNFKLKNSKFSLTVLSSHLDNLDANRLGALKTIKKIQQKVDSDLVVVAMDSNTRAYDKEYQEVADLYTNTFYDNIPNKYSEVSGKELCYRHKGKKFPKCMVDHILYYSKNNLVSTKDWTIHQNKPGGKFLSDHRPVTTQLEIKWE